MSARVQVIDHISSQILFECDISELDTAYVKAREYEEMGLDIKILAPGLGETLIKSLGATNEDIELYKKSMESEIDSHTDNLLNDYGCSICPPKK